MERAFIGIFILLILLIIYFIRNTSNTIEIFSMISLSDIEEQNPQLKNPEYLLPSNNTASDPGSQDGEDYYKDLKIIPTISNSKVIFDDCF